MNKKFYQALTVGFSLMLASSLTVNAQKVTFNGEKLSLKQAFEKIESVSKYKIAYNISQLDVSKMVVLNQKNKDVLQVLEDLLNGTGCTYRINENYIVITSLEKSTVKKVQGVVKDTSGEPVIGATVMVKGTTVGTITDFDGNFALDALEGALLEVSYIGYKTQQLNAITGKSLVVTLREDTEVLDEVVVVGYGTIKKENLTGAVSAVDEKVLSNRPIVNLGQGLQGTIPNLNITTSGRPGEGSTFNVRGFTSLNGGSPLILVDGVEMDPNLVNPQDIQSISVLKDAASASIYGSRAAFGVILITLKKGHKNTKPHLSLDASLSFNSPTTRPEYMNSMQYADWMNAASMNTNGNEYFDAEWMQHIRDYYNDPVNNLPVFVHSDPNVSSNGRKYTYCGNTDWMDTMYKKNYPVQKYNINLNGGNDNTTYYTSFGYIDQGSLVRYGNENYRKFNVTNNISYDITSWLTLSNKTSYIRTELSGLNQDNYHGDTFIGGDIRPIMPVKHPDGHWSGQGDFTNFAAVLEDGGNRTTTKNDFWNTMALQLKPLQGLTINADYSFNYFSEHNKIHLKSIDEFGANGNFLQTFVWSKPNWVSESQMNATYNAFNLYGDYEKTIGSHYFKIMIGYNQETKHYRNFEARINDLISNDLPSMGAATGEKTVKNGDDSWATRSGFARINYILKDRYLLELNGRYDLSSKFPKNSRNVFNPSFSMAWKVSEEQWMKQLTNGFFDELKFKGSYGSLGNQALDNGWYAYLSNYSTGKMLWVMGGNQYQYVSPGNLVSSHITWETVVQWNVGIDFSCFSHKLKGGFDYFGRSTKDMLAPGKVLPSIIGMKEPLANAADLTTKGWEMFVSWNDMLDNGLHYTIGFNMSDAITRITKFDNPSRNLGENNHYVGEVIGEIWGYETAGLFQSKDEIKTAPDHSLINGGVEVLPGDIRFVDLDGNNRIDWGENTVDNPGDQKIIGNTTPRYRYGLNMSMDWKGLDFSLFWEGVAKRDIVLPEKLFYAHYRSQWEVPSKVNVDYWSESNRDAYFPVPRFNGGNAISQKQSKYLQNGAYCRLKSLVLGYSLPSSWINKLGMQKCRFYVSGENLLTFKHSLDGFDPELDNPYKYPLQKSISFGLNVIL